MNLKIIVQLLFTTFIWGLSFHAAKEVVGGLSFDQVALGRYAIASVFFLICTPLSIQQYRTLLRQQGWPLLFLALVGIFGYSLLLFLAIPHVSAVNAALIMSFTPALTALLSRFLLKTILSVYQLFGLLLGIAGVLFIITKGQWTLLKDLKFGQGELLLVLNSFLFALANVFNRKYLPKVNSNESAAVTTHITTLLCLITVLVNNKPLPFSALTVTALLALLILGVLGSFVAHRLWYHSVSQAGADKAAYFLNLVPFFTALISIGKGLPPTSYQIVGGGLIIAGIFLSLYKKQSHEVNKAILVRCTH